MVNGDDILFRTNPEHYDIWKRHVFNIGFTLSVGKNYIHESVLTINSTMFQHKEGILRKVDFCNFGLLSGTAKLGGSRGEVREKAIELRDAYVKSVGGSIDRPLAMSRFMTRNSASIAKITMSGRYNLFLPREVGGLGFPIYDGVNFRVTRFQMCLAKLLSRTSDGSPICGFKTVSKSNMVMGYESKNMKIKHVGFGPLNFGLREISRDMYTSTNSCYNQEAEVKWFTKIPIKYDSKTLFPFRLGEKDLDYTKYESYRFVESFWDFDDRRLVESQC